MCAFNLVDAIMMQLIQGGGLVGKGLHRRAVVTPVSCSWGSAAADRRKLRRAPPPPSPSPSTSTAPYLDRGPADQTPYIHK